MRTETEIKRQIEGLEIMKNNLPEVSAFGHNNHEQIDAQIDVLQNDNYEEYKNAEDRIESACYDVKMWLDGEMEEDLFE